MTKSKAILSIALLVINLCIIYFLNLKVTLHQALKIHVFLFSLLLLTDTLKNKLLDSNSTISLLLLGINFLRIVLCVLFLLPTILSYDKADNSYIYNFFIVYFLMLFSGILLIHKNDNKIKE